MIRAFLLGGLAAAVLALPAAAQTWVVDKAKSSLTFSGRASGGPFQGRFQTWDAQIAFDPKDLAAAKATVSVQLASATTGVADADGLLPSAAFFDAAKFPRATFSTRRFVDRGGGRYDAVGDLTIKGVTKPLTLPFTLAVNGNTAQMTSAIALNRGAFGVGTGQFSSDATISNTIQLRVNLTATRR